MENLSLKKTFEQNYFGGQRVKGVKNDLVPPPAINSPGYDKVFHCRVSCRSRTFYKFFKQHLRWQFFKRLSAKMRPPPLLHSSAKVSFAFYIAPIHSLPSIAEPFS